MEVGESMNRNGWFLWCGVGTIAENHEQIENLTKQEAIEEAVRKSYEWPRVLICQKSAKYPRGITLAGIQYGRMSGKILEDAYNAGNPAIVEYIDKKCGGEYRKG